MHQKANGSTLADRIKECYDRALKLLARREHSVRELTFKLAARGYDRTSIDHVIASLKRDNYQSDDRYAEVLVRSRIARNEGPLKIRARLFEKGISDQLIQKHLSDDEAFWIEQALKVDCQLRQREGHALAQVDDRTRFAKRARRLKNRGYPASVISRVVSEPW